MGDLQIAKRIALLSAAARRLLALDLDARLASPRQQLGCLRLSVTRCCSAVCHFVLDRGPVAGLPPCCPSKGSLGISFSSFFFFLFFFPTRFTFSF